MRDYLKRVFEGGDADGENSATVDSISTHKDYVGAIVFCDPDKLDENVEKINERRPKAAGGASQFFWQYHKIFKRLLEEIAPYEYPLFSKISETRKKIEGAQIAYVIIRRLTLAAFLTLAVLTAPSSFFAGQMPESFMGAVLTFGQDLHLRVDSQRSWYFLISAIVVAIFGVNFIAKRLYDGRIVDITSALSSILQKYTQDLYIDGFKKSLDRINDEEATEGALEDKTVWPSRAAKWAKIAYWHGKRIEWTTRYTQIEVWISQRSLRMVDHLSRVANIILLVAFPVIFVFGNWGADVIWPQIWASLFISALVYLGWDYLGSENVNVLEATLLAPDKQQWKKDAEISEEFSGQILKDKARIQRSRDLKP